MKGKLIRGAIGLVIIMILGGLSYFAARQFLSRDKEEDAKIEDIVDNPIPEQKVKLNTKFEAVSADKYELNDITDIYIMIHQMSNTMIIAKDGKIRGEINITRQTVDIVKKAVKELNIQDAEINETLEMWGNQDFSQCVSQHNYVWDKLDGNEGKASKLK